VSNSTRFTRGRGFMRRTRVHNGKLREKMQYPEWTPPPVASQMGKHHFNNPEGEYEVRCDHCGQVFTWNGFGKTWELK